jgi:hypothetical protein
MKGVFESKRFWLTVGSVAFVILNDRLNLEITEEQIQTIALAIGALVVGDSLRAVAPKTAE